MKLVSKFQHKIIFTPAIRDQHVQKQKFRSFKTVYFIARLSNVSSTIVKLASLYFSAAADYFQLAIFHPINFQESFKKKKKRDHNYWCVESQILADD